MAEIKFAPYTATQAVKRAKAMVGDYAYTGMCQAFTVTRFGLGGLGDRDGDGDADAVDGWKSAQGRVHAKDIKSYKSIPSGVMLYWDGGSRGYGHAAISIGNGKMVTTDYRNGQIGIANIQGWWASSHRFLGYVTKDANGYVLRDRIREPLMRIGTYNIAWDNPKYQTRMGQRTILIAEAFCKLQFDLLAVQERPNKYGEALDERLRIRRGKGRNKKNIKRVAGASGRYTYASSIVKTTWKASRDVSDLKDGREKPFTVSEHTVKGVEFLFVNAHPQPGSDSKSIKVREDQCEDIYNQVIRIANNRNVPKGRIIWAGDWQGRQMRDFLTKKGYLDAARVAKRAYFKSIKSFNGGKKKPQTGARIDYVCLDPDYWDVQSTTQRWWIRSDHNPQIVNIYYTR